MKKPTFTKTLALSAASLALFVSACNSPAQDAARDAAEKNNFAYKV
jgi:protein involved in sex pheromone biosynthesis